MPELLRWIPPSAPGSMLQTPGGTLGVGLPGAVGIKLAHPDRTVIGFTGDGGAMYTFQALWTAAHYRIGAKFVVCNNRSYRLLKQNLVDYWGDAGIRTTAFPPSFDISKPDLDFVALAKGVGVAGRFVSKLADVRGAVEEMLAHEGPYLLELALEREVKIPDVPSEEAQPARGRCSGDLPCS
jgi:benzoylformate decarboxylase